MYVCVLSGRVNRFGCKITTKTYWNLTRQSYHIPWTVWTEWKSSSRLSALWLCFRWTPLLAECRLGDSLRRVMELILLRLRLKSLPFRWRPLVNEEVLKRASQPEPLPSRFRLFGPFRLCPRWKELLVVAVVEMNSPLLAISTDRHSLESSLPVISVPLSVSPPLLDFLPTRETISKERHNPDMHRQWASLVRKDKCT